MHTNETPGKACEAIAFIDTRWSIVLLAKRPSDAMAHDALETLCRTYWYPLYGYVRRCGHDPVSAKDLTQDFFAHLINRNCLEHVDQSKGRFRSFLLAAMRNFLANQRARADAIKRGGTHTFVSLDELAEQKVSAELAVAETPEKLFDRAWAITITENALADLSKEYEESGKSELFGMIQPYLSGDRDGAGYVVVARELKMSEAAVKMAVVRMRRRFGQLLRIHVAQTVDDAAVLEDELRYLFSALVT